MTRAGTHDWWVPLPPEEPIEWGVSPFETDHAHIEAQMELIRNLAAHYQVPIWTAQQRMVSKSLQFAVAYGMSPDRYRKLSEAKSKK